MLFTNIMIVKFYIQLANIGPSSMLFLLCSSCEGGGGSSGMIAIVGFTLTVVNEFRGFLSSLLKKLDHLTCSK